MTYMVQGRIIRALIGLTAVFCLVVTGCSGTKDRKSGGTTSTSKSKEGKPPSQLYYDFGDVLIPSDLKLDRKSSFIFQTPSMIAGVLALSGRVETNSLIHFFETNMIKDNWEPVSSFKSVRTIMLYRKENRWCVINISETSFKTNVEIWVAPTTANLDSGLLEGSVGS